MRGLTFTADPVRDFWRASGFSLLTRDAGGNLAVTDDYLRAYWRRPETAPVEESCQAELALHAELLKNPAKPLGEAELAKLADPDARENYAVVRDFRDRLVRAGTVERAYLGLFEEENLSIPPMFMDQMAHVILRNMLESVTDPFRVKAGEILFREQNVTIEAGQVLLGDREVVNMLAATRGMGGLGQLISEAGVQSRQVNMDVLTPDNADDYWDRDDRYDMVLDLTFARPGLDALCRVLETWVRHFLKTEVEIQPVQEISDEKWVWHIGLDVTATEILNRLYAGEELPREIIENILSLFRLVFEDPNQMREDLRGRPVYLALCKTENGRLRLKPQNLLVNLPLAAEQ